MSDKKLIINEKLPNQNFLKKQAVVKKVTKNAG